MYILYAYAILAVNLPTYRPIRPIPVQLLDYPDRICICKTHIRLMRNLGDNFDAWALEGFGPGEWNLYTVSKHNHTDSSESMRSYSPP